MVRRPKPAYVDFFYEFASTYSYPAAMRLEAEAQKAKIEVRWRPFLLGPIFKDQGLKNSPFIDYPVKGEYMWRDVWRVCKRYGAEFKKPASFPQNGLLAARVATALDPHPRMLFSRAIFTAQFSHGRDIAEHETVADAIKAAGFDADTALQEAATPRVRAALRAATDEAKKRGVFGAPTFIVSDNELFWGNDRLEEALDWAKRLNESP